VNLKKRQEPELGYWQVDQSRFVGFIEVPWVKGLPSFLSYADIGVGFKIVEGGYILYDYL
jgi:hypothetical protein